MSQKIDRVIITGASSGIGFDLAARFLAEGSRVVINGRIPPSSSARAPGWAIPIGWSPSRARSPNGRRSPPSPGRRSGTRRGRRPRQQRRHLRRQALPREHRGRPRRFLGPTWSTYFLTQAIVPLMIKGGGGSILNVGTVLVDQAMTGLPVSAAMAARAG